MISFLDVRLVFHLWAQTALKALPSLSPLIILWIVLTSSFSFASEENYISIEGVVVSFLYGDRPRPLPGVTVILKGTEQQWHEAVTDDGEFTFRVPIGTYDASFHLTGFYEGVIRNIKVQEEPIDHLVVALIPEGPMPHKDYKVVGPRLVPAPALWATLSLVEPVKKGAPMRGKVTLTNEGSQTVLIPTENRRHKPEFLGLGITVTPRGPHVADAPYSALASTWFFCDPDAGDCTELPPGEKVSLVVDFQEKKFYGTELNQIERYDVNATYKGTLSVYFALPKSGDEETERRTESIQSEIELRIRLP